MPEESRRSSDNLLWEIKGRMDTLESGVVSIGGKVDRLLDSLNRTTALETSQRDIAEHVDRLEQIQKTQANELAENRGAGNANRWLAVLAAPIVCAVIEAARYTFGVHSK